MKLFSLVTLFLVFAAAAFSAESSFKQGMNIGSYTTTQKNAISAPIAGRTVYDITKNAISYYNGASWINISSTTSTAINPASPLFNAIKWQGTNVSNASPTAVYILRAYSATDTAYLPTRIVGTGSSTVSFSSAGGLGTITVHSTNGGTGGAGGPEDIQFTGIYLRPADGTATPASIVNVGEDTPLLQFLKSTASGTQTAWFSHRTVPSKWTNEKLRVKIGYYLSGDNSSSEKVKINVMGTCTKAGNGYSGLLATFTLPYTITWAASSTNRIVISSSTLDIPAANFEAGAKLDLKIQRVTPSGTESDAKLRILDITGVWQ